MADTNWTVACATADGHNLLDEHFGEAHFYAIYTLGEEGFERVAEVPNPMRHDAHDDDHEHHDPGKAKNIAGVLKKHAVEVIVGLQFGANIARMKKRFVPVVSKNIVGVEDVMQALLVRRADVAREHAAGEKRRAIVLKHET